MREIGPHDKLLTEQSYHLWPLFLEFRETDQFATAYQDLFGHSYSAKLEQELLAASAGAAREADRQVTNGGPDVRPPAGPEAEVDTSETDTPSEASTLAAPLADDDSE
jgi:hypothetical protein